MPPSIHLPASRLRKAYTLVELMVVVVVITMLTVASGQLLQSFMGSTSVSKASEDLSGAYEIARIYSMKNRTYTRVGIAMVSRGGSADFYFPGLVVATIYSVDGSLAYDDAGSMADNDKWKLVDKPKVLRNFWLYDSLEASTPSTTNDTNITSTDIDIFCRKVEGMGSFSFGCIVQFTPAGEAHVLKSEPARFVKIGIDQPNNVDTPGSAPLKRNPFILRLSGINGNVSIIRKENIL